MAEERFVLRKANLPHCAINFHFVKSWEGFEMHYGFSLLYCMVLLLLPLHLHCGRCDIHRIESMLAVHTLRLMRAAESDHVLKTSCRHS